MTDIVERLQGLKSSIKTVDELNVIIAAMEEIERLRKILADIEHALAAVTVESD